MSTELFGSSVFERAQEDPEEAVITRPVAETRGLQPEDLGALVHLLLLPPNMQATAKDLAAGMRTLGWKMSIDRFEVIAKRLRAAGHLLRKSVYNPATKRPEWRYRAYRNPANNPEYVAQGAQALSQVREGTGENPVPSQPLPSELGENPVSPGQSRNRVSPGSEANSGKTRFPSERVSAGQSRNRGKPGFESSPPHPPGEVTTSPLPPTSDTTGHVSVPSPREEEAEAGYTEKDLQEAADVLQLLPTPWTQGRLNAGKLAPKLLDVMAVQGWPDIHFVERRLLVEQLTKNPHKVTNPYRLLAGDRIPNLPRYSVVASTASKASPSGSTPDGMCPLHPTYRAGNRCVPCVTA